MNAVEYVVQPMPPGRGNAPDIRAPLHYEMSNARAIAWYVLSLASKSNPLLRTDGITNLPEWYDCLMCPHEALGSAI